MLTTQLTEREMDALREVGNIGAGNAATALSQLLGQVVLLEIPRVRAVQLRDTIASIRRYEPAGAPDIASRAIVSRVAWSKAASSVGAPAGADVGIGVYGMPRLLARRKPNRTPDGSGAAKPPLNR